MRAPWDTFILMWWKRNLKQVTEDINEVIWLDNIYKKYITSTYYTYALKLTDAEDKSNPIGCNVYMLTFLLVEVEYLI